MVVCDAKVTKNVSYKKEGGKTTFTADIAPCYPAEAGVKTLQRTYVFDRDAAAITMTDCMALTGEENTVDFVFMTPVAPTVEAGRFVVPVDGGRDVAVTFCECMTANVQEVSTEGDPALEEGWGKCVYRTVVSAKCGSELQTTFTFTQC